MGLDLVLARPQRTAAAACVAGAGLDLQFAHLMDAPQPCHSLHLPVFRVFVFKRGGILLCRLPVAQLAQHISVADSRRPVARLRTQDPQVFLLGPAWPAARAVDGCELFAPFHVPRCQAAKSLEPVLRIVEPVLIAARRSGCRHGTRVVRVVGHGERAVSIDLLRRRGHDFVYLRDRRFVLLGVGVGVDSVRVMSER